MNNQPGRGCSPMELNNIEIISREIGFVSLSQIKKSNLTTFTSSHWYH